MWKASLEEFHSVAYKHQIENSYSTQLIKYYLITTFRISMSVGHPVHVLLTVYNATEHVTQKSPGPMCGWVGRILHPDSCTSGSSWSKVPPWSDGHRNVVIRLLFNQLCRIWIFYLTCERECGTHRFHLYLTFNDSCSQNQSLQYTAQINWQEHSNLCQGNSTPNVTDPDNHCSVLAITHHTPPKNLIKICQHLFELSH